MPPDPRGRLPLARLFARVGASRPTAAPPAAPPAAARPTRTPAELTRLPLAAALIGFRAPTPSPRSADAAIE